MRTFKDMTGREWTLSATIDALRRIKDQLKLDLANPFEGTPPALARLDLDVMLLCDCIFVAVKPQADEQNITSEQFGAAMGGDALIAARDAWMEELEDFFRLLRRPEVVKAVEKQTEIVRTATEAAARKLDALDLNQQVEAALADSTSGS